nr:hypothetical protein [Candidatus Shapirobacteria bacterium]
MKKLVLLFSLILCLFPKPTFAIQVNIAGFDFNNVIIGTSFPVTFDITQATPDTQYRYKFFGGTADHNNSIQTYNLESENYLSNSDDWANMPTFTTDYSGYARVEGLAYIPISQDYCSSYSDYCFNLLINISDSENQTFSTPAPYVISVVSPFTPTPIYSPNSVATTTNISPNNPSTPSENKITPTATSFPTNPVPTIDLKKFSKTIATTSAITSIISSGSIGSETSPTDINTIQTGSNPIDQTETFQIPDKHQTSSKTVLKILFVFLMASFSFVLYSFSFCDLPFNLEKLIPHWQKISHHVSTLSKNIFKTLKGFIEFIHPAKKYLYNLFKTKIKIPRRLKRYLYHQKNKFLILFFFLIPISFSIKPVSASIFSNFSQSKIPIIHQNNTVDLKQDFSWGVLAINPNKSVYSVGETADFSLAVLDEEGSVLCNAELDLEIIFPDGSTKILSRQNGEIIVSPECRNQSFNLGPDYQSFLSLTQKGRYQISLTAKTKNGQHTIKDFFTVKDNPSYSIERTTATRIYPANIYPVSLTITANKDFEGNISEEVPSSFTITDSKADTKTEGNRKILTWSVSLKKGEIITLNYKYKAPEISPDLLFIGPLTLSSNSFIKYQEPRRWQIAVDDITFKIQTGYFMGNGSYKSITGLGFAPEMVIIKSDTNNTATLLKTNAMAHNTTAYFMSTADNTAGFISLDNDGFTLTSSGQTALIRYTWIAFAGSDCSSTGSFCLGSFQGTGTASRNI